MKKLFQIMLAIVAIVTMAMVACSCSPSSITSALNDYTGKLQTPEGIYLDEDNVLRWNSVPNAASYIVTIEEKDYERSTVACDLKKILKTNGTYEVFVKAKSDKINISDSDYSEGVTIKFTGAKADEGDEQTETKLFGEFEDILTKEAYIGYGYNVIDSSYVNANEVKWQYPIFDTEKLKQQRLLINKERNTNDEYISGNSMESYQENFMAKLESKLKVKKAFSASLKGKYESTSESTASALFYEYRHSTTYYRLYLQCDFQEYKNMLTDSFKRDLMNLDIPSLFQYYGTHLITSAAMGGRFDINYTMLSDKVIDTQKLSASMDTTLKAWSVDVNVDASAEISSKATSNNCTIHTESNTIGGGSVAMNNEKAILTNYQKWLSTIEESPALIGICDINSLYPIWNLLGDSNEEQARKKEISDYFTKYGDEAYRETLKMFNIKEPPKINDFSVVLLDENKKPLKDNVAMAGSTIYIKAIVDPEDAPISKSVTIKDSELYDLKYNSGDGSIYIKDGIPHNTIIYINVDIGGGFSKDLAIKVLGSYTVRFACDGGKTKDGEALSAIKVCNGDILEAPEQIYKEGYVFKGWYTDEICSEENKFKFGRQTITVDTILYAKWDTFCPTISFSSNIAGGALESVKVNYNEVFARPGDPTLEGYTFDGFYANEELTTSFDFSKAITKDTTIYLKWNINSYTVTFDPDGGSIVSGKNQVTVKYNSLIEAPVCSKVGAEFAGWYIDPDKTVLFDFANDKVKGNMTLYAKWANNLLTVKFDSGCDIKIDDRKINYNTTLGVNFPSVDREGYKLIGWYKEESFKNKVTDATIFNDSNFENLSTEKVTTLYAKWSPITYTVSYNPNGGAGTMTDNELSYDEKNQLNENTFVKTGCRFIGWATSADGDVLYGDKATVKNLTTEDGAIVYLYAKWEKVDYRISYEFNGGVKIDGGNYPVDYYNIEEDCTISDLQYSSYPEYNYFLGWYEDAEFTKPFANDLNENPRDIELFAKWDLVICYNTLEETPKISAIGDRNRVIIDWSGYPAGTYNYSAAIDPDGDNVRNEGGNTNLEVSNSITEIYFIGNSRVTFTGLSIVLCLFDDGQTLNLKFKDFKFQGTSNTIWGYECKNFNLNMEFIGDNEISSSSGSALSQLANTEITGSGNLSISGANGGNGGQYAAGGDGQVAISVNVLIINTSGTMTIKGGNGGNGGNTSSDTGRANSLRTAGSGGNGADAISCTSCTIIGNVAIKAGNGGNGGYGYKTKNNAGIGGNGGNGGHGIRYSNTYSVSNSVSSSGGSAGAGGNAQKWNVWGGDQKKGSNGGEGSAYYKS